MSDYKQRVIQERDELNEKHDKLLAFIEGSSTFKVLPEEEQELLQDQEAYMEAYVTVLNKRIERF